MMFAQHGSLPTLQDDCDPGSVGVNSDILALITEVQRANMQLITACDRAERARQEAEAANRLKDEFLATVAHEMRTPLNVILGWARLLELHHVRPERADEAVAVIARASGALTNMVDDLLDATRLLNGTLRMRKHAVDITAIARSAVETVRPSAEAKGLTLAFETTTDDRTVAGDASRLQQVLWNLLTNAIKFTPAPGCVRLSVESIADQVEIRVVDTGDGISGDLLPYVFDRYRQADGATTARRAGLGLGLSIVRRLVELHGGWVGAESPGPGRGASFTVRLPLAVRDGNATFEKGDGS